MGADFGNCPKCNRTHKKAAGNAHGLFIKRSSELLDFAFFVFDVLANNWVVLTHNHFFGHGTCVFLGHVEVASARGRVQADFDRGWLRHFTSPASGV